MSIVIFSLRIDMLKETNSKVCRKYTLIIIIYNFEIHLMTFSEERSGENFPAEKNPLVFHAANHWMRLP